MLPLFLTIGITSTSCSSSDDDEQPILTTTRLEQGTDSRPDWQVPNYNLFEMTMSIEINLQDTLQSYASQRDLLCATINGEVRGVATPQQVGGVWLFPLTIGSNEGNVPITLSYYCDNLHRIFTTPWTQFDATTMPMGTGDIYHPTFLE